MATSNEVSNFFVAESVVRNTPNYDGLDILPLRSEIAFDSTNIRFYLLGIHHQLQIWSVRIYHSKWRIYKATCSSIPSNFRAGPFPKHLDPPFSFEDSRVVVRRVNRVALAPSRVVVAVAVRVAV